MAETLALEALVRRAVDGDRDAVASIVRELQANVYALALRMLWHPQDAEDATQEIRRTAIATSESRAEPIRQRQVDAGHDDALALSGVDATPTSEQC